MGRRDVVRVRHGSCGHALLTDPVPRGRARAIPYPYPYPYQYQERSQIRKGPVVTRNTRTAAQKNARLDSAHKTTTAIRLLVRVLQDVVRSQVFAEYGDLVETFKVRCARLRIAYTATLITAAIDQLERGGRTPIIRRTARRVVDVPSVGVDVSRQDAHSILSRVVAEWRARGPR